MDAATEPALHAASGFSMTPSANGFRTKAGMQSQSDLQWSKILSSFPRSCVGMPTDPEQRAEATIKLDPRHSCARRNPVKPTLDSCFRRNDEVCSATPSWSVGTRHVGYAQFSYFNPASLLNSLVLLVTKTKF